MRRNNGGNYTNPCLTMHQPWASLLVYGIKRVEGRSWPAPIRGRLWIHAAGKVPEPETIKAMEDFYREIYAVNGITDLKFPENYPTSRLLGCVEVVGCIKCEELQSWEELPEGVEHICFFYFLTCSPRFQTHDVLRWRFITFSCVICAIYERNDVKNCSFVSQVRLEGQSDYCWLCEQPQKLIIPFEMRGQQHVYNLEKKIYEAAVRGLRPVEAPHPVKFPLVDPQDAFSLKAGSLAGLGISKASEKGMPSSLSNAIAGARAAAVQFSKEDSGDACVEIEAENSVASRTRCALKGKVQNEEK
ncbi:uncharacterized protein LOC130809259 isoform X2 [Amaranthus tricolor]|uniref:uncharacterized protein LOC130809259 isoform X2 n=1 Tax=Amaranthus tricolor TaxID=29722 RepID=UPI0025888FED|nr:uncharacterized protein LOC130809259 isoform X2 [Amaranthus tricolor]